MRKFTAILSVLVLLSLLVGVGAAQGPAITTSGHGQPAALPAAANPEDVLWEQYTAWTGTDYAAQQFGAGWEMYDIYAADDFYNGEAWSIDTITTRGGWGGFIDVSVADSINWWIYADCAGEPCGLPGDGGEEWSAILPPSDPQVALGVGEAEDIVLSLDTPIELPAGTWWLVHQVSLDFNIYGVQWGWSGNEYLYGGILAQNNPGGGFGLPPGWVPNDNGDDATFRLEGTAGGADTLMYVQSIEMKEVPGKIQGMVHIVDEYGAFVVGAAVDAEWTRPFGAIVPWVAYTNANGWAGFRIPAGSGGPYDLCVQNVTAAGYVYDPGMNWEDCDTYNY